jgi:hypothetical protein
MLSHDSISQRGEGRYHIDVTALLRKPPSHALTSSRMAPKKEEPTQKTDKDYGVPVRERKDRLGPIKRAARDALLRRTSTKR